MLANVGSPILLLPEFTLPAALPGAAQWISPIPVDDYGFTQLTLIQLIGITDSIVYCHKTPPSTAAATSNLIIPGTKVYAGQIVDLTYDTMNVIPAGYSLWLYASTGTCNVGVHGFNWS